MVQRQVFFVLDVAPEPSKLGRDIFSQMLGELWNEDLFMADRKIPEQFLLSLSW